MSRSQPFNLIVHLFAPVWEASNRYKGMEYDAGGTRDYHEAKVFIQMHPDVFEEKGMASFQEHAIEYLKSNHDAWTNQNHPAWGLLRNYSSFAPKKIRETVKRKQMRLCTDCGQEHGMHDPCPVME